jgi:hypothetical protein
MFVQQSRFFDKIGQLLYCPTAFSVTASHHHLIGIAGGANLPRDITIGPKGIEVSLTADYLVFIRAVLLSAAPPARGSDLRSSSPW